jgi:hypothetical protein
MNTSEPELPRVFLGTPSVLSPEQQPELDRWVTWLQRRSCDVLRMGRDSYGADPWRTLSNLIAHCDGAVLLGFRQLDARTAIWRPDTKEEAPSAGWWTSPWLQIEAGMAAALHVPLLVAAEPPVEDGVFQPDVWGPQVTGVPLTGPGPAADHWLSTLREHRGRRTAPE